MRLILSTGKIFEEQDILNKIDREREREIVDLTNL